MNELSFLTVNRVGCFHRHQTRGNSREVIARVENSRVRGKGHGMARNHRRSRTVRDVHLQVILFQNTNHRSIAVPCYVGSENVRKVGQHFN